MGFNRSDKTADSPFDFTFSQFLSLVDSELLIR
jgi:hypothetical protein